MNADETLILKALDTAVRSPAAAALIKTLGDRLDSVLAQRSASPMAWEAVPLNPYGDSLPQLIRSRWCSSSGSARRAAAHVDDGSQA